MSVIKYNPVTSSRRSLITLNYRSLWKGKPFKSLLTKNNVSGGRNNMGRLTTRNATGRAKRSYRIIDFLRFRGIAKVIRIEYDPNRTANIALMYCDGKYTYILAPRNLKIGDKVKSSLDPVSNIGDCTLLKNIPIGSQIHNVEIKPGKGGQIARAAGSFVTIVNKKLDKVHIKLSSGEIIIVCSACRATLGQVSNPDVKHLKYAKAGRMRWLGYKPVVRGVAMNPIDHPHGGGEGKTSGGRHPVNKNGLPTKGFRTRNNKRTDVFILRSRHNKN